MTRTRPHRGTGPRLVKHLTAAERYGFARSFAAEDIPPADFGRELTDEDGAADVVRSLRRVLVHMTEETARHPGHADILREQTDGAVGR